MDKRVKCFIMAGMSLFAMQVNLSYAQQSTNSKTTYVYDNFSPGKTWYDNQGEVINAHGGGLLYADKTYYWFGERREKQGTNGINVYSSRDLYNWKYEGMALSTDSTNAASDIAKGCVMERPKVIYNAKTHQYVLWFHLELKDRGYSAARAAVAVSDKVTGPYRFISSFRPNGNMSRDMTLFVDDNGTAYQVYSSNENYDLRIVKLTDDYLQPTTDDHLLFSNHREAPAVFKCNQRYYLITSACTGWAPNKASVHVADVVTGPWKKLEYNPMSGPGADSTFGGQSAYVQPVAGKHNAFIFVADIWRPQDLRDSRYVWLPIRFNEGNPVVEWTENWNLSTF